MDAEEKTIYPFSEGNNRKLDVGGENHIKNHDKHTRKKNKWERDYCSVACTSIHPPSQCTSTPQGIKGLAVLWLNPLVQQIPQSQGH